MSTPIMTQKIMSVAMKNKCHTVLFSELICSYKAVCRSSEVSLKKKEGESERENGTTGPRRKREKIDSPVQKTAARLALCPKHRKTEREKWS